LFISRSRSLHNHRPPTTPPHPCGDGYSQKRSTRRL
jgi:hypothetical protein